MNNRYFTIRVANYHILSDVYSEIKETDRIVSVYQVDCEYEVLVEKDFCKCEFDLSSEDEEVEFSEEEIITNDREIPIELLTKSKTV